MTEQTGKTPEKVEMVKVKLLGPHTHKREDFKRGDALELRKKQADRLIDKKRAVVA